jgi:hypothetical protein
LAELYYTQKAIKTVVGVTPKYWRPPFGDIDDRVRWIATQLNLTAIIWNLDTNDWAAGSTVPLTTVQQSYQDYITMGTNGTFSTYGNIVLTHEIDNTTMSLALEYLPQIKAAYKNVLDIATCANLTNPYSDSNITYLAFGASNTTTASASGASSLSTAASGSSASASAASANTVVKNGAASMFDVKTGFLTVASIILVGLLSQ